MAIKKVEAIIPTEVVQAIKQEKEPIDAVVEVAEKTEMSKKEKKAEAKFQKLRLNLILDGLGVDKKTYQEFIQDFEMAEKGDSRLHDSRIKQLKDKRNIFKVQKGANNNDFKDTLKDSLIGGSSLAMLLLGVNVAIPTPITVLAGVTGIAYNVYRYKKRSKGNRSDEYDKQNSYQKELYKFIKDSKKLEKAIDEDRQILEEHKNSLTKKEFKIFKENYIKEKVAMLKIESPFVSDKEIQDSLVEPKGAIFKAENPQILAEAGI